jgi:hypothetical protein
VTGSFSKSADGSVEIIFEHPVGEGILRIVKRQRWPCNDRYDISAYNIRAKDKPELVLIIAGYLE